MAKQTIENSLPFKGYFLMHESNILSLSFNPRDRVEMQLLVISMQQGL
ncbi:MAG: hypothetical protein ACFFCC_10425 [Promethearchaeota archaeon]